MLRALSMSLLLLLGPAMARAAEVVLLKSQDTPEAQPALEAIRRALVSHQVVEIDLRGDAAEATRQVAGFKARPVIFVAMGPLAAGAIRDGAPERPMVFCMVDDPAALALPARPMTTGIMAALPVRIQLAAFRSLLRGTRVGVMYQPAVLGRQIEDATKAAPMLRLLLTAQPVGSAADVRAALRVLLKGDAAVDALWLPPDPIFFAEETRRHVLSEAAKAGKPVFAYSAALLAEGATATHQIDAASIGELVADHVARLASGEPAAEKLAVPRSYLMINGKVAEKLKIEIPPHAKVI